MNTHRFILEPYQSGKPTRFDCPSCGENKKFARYIDSHTHGQLADHVGRCERANNCGYHYTPREFFSSNPNQINFKKSLSSPTPGYEENGTSARSVLTTIPIELLKASRKGYEDNAFVEYLRSHFDIDTVNQLISRYHIGSSKRWDGATVFWWTTPEGTVTGGQVVLFGKDGHTAKYTDSNGNRQRCTRPIHKVLLRQYAEKKLTPPEWLTNYDQHSEKFPTLFGLHQLKTEPTNKPVAVVEAPATAIVASAYFPDFIWLATGSLDWLTEKRLMPLKGRKVALFPDLNGYENWSRKAEKFQHITRFTVSDLLERIATEEERTQGLDLRDYLTRFEVEKFRHQTTDVTHAPEPESIPVQVGIQKGVEVLQVYPCDTYPEEWDEPNSSGKKPTISAVSFHEWQQKETYFGQMGLPSLNKGSSQSHP